MGLVVGGFVVTLLFQGYVHNEIGHASTADSRGVRPPAKLDLDAGPLLRLTHDRLVATNPPRRTVALTYDDGPDTRWTPRLLRLLRREHVPATFFVVGSRAIAHPEIVRAELRAGNDVGSHTFTHVNLARLSEFEMDAQLAMTKAAIAGAAGIETSLLRPPYSSTPDAITDRDYRAWLTIAHHGYTVIVANTDGEDWRRDRSVDRIVRDAMPHDDRGAVVLLHDGGGNRSRTIAATARLIPRLRARGYHFVTVHQLLGPRSDVIRRASRSDELRGTLLVAMGRVSATVTRAFAALVVAVTALSLARMLLLVLLARRRRGTPRAAFARGRVPAVSVVVPAFNEEVGIGATITSLATSAYPGALEIVVVDDGSTDATAAVVDRLIRDRAFANVRLVRQENAGKAAALNTGLQCTSAPVVVMVDGDTILAVDAIAQLAAPFADDAVGAVSGNTKIGNRRGLLGRWQHVEYVIGFSLERRAYATLDCMPTVPGAIGAFRRAALEQVGRLSETTLAEDTDLTMAVHRGGWRVAYQPDAIAFTEAPSTLRGLWRQRLRWSYGTMQAMWKHRSGFRDQRPEGRRFARLGLSYMIVFQVALPAIAPLLDAATLYGLLFFDPRLMLAYWLGFNFLQMALGWYAFRLDGEPAGPLLLVPLQQFVWRQLMYLVIWESLLNAAAGTRLRWHTAPRVGQSPSVAIERA